MQVTINKSTLELKEGDITDLATDAIVNAANSQLLLGSGVAGAIRFKGGPTIQAECLKIGHCVVGSAVLTGAGDLPAKHIVHAVGPQMGEGDEDEKLASATRKSLELAAQHNLQSIAFPAISTGVFGFPIERCSEIMLQTAVDFLGNETSIKQVVFCLYGRAPFKIFQMTLEKMARAE